MTTEANEGREEKIKSLLRQAWDLGVDNYNNPHGGFEFWFEREGIKNKIDVALRNQLSKEREKYNDLLSSVQRHFQTLIARNYNNIGVWSNERQDYNFQLIKEIEDFLKEHNTKATELDKNLKAGTG